MRPFLYLIKVRLICCIYMLSTFDAFHVQIHHLLLLFLHSYSSGDLVVGVMGLPLRRQSLFWGFVQTEGKMNLC